MFLKGTSFSIRCIIFLIIIFELVSFIVFPFFDYKYVEYEKNTYVINRNLKLENVLEYDENGEICGYSDGKKQYVKVNGWNIEQMVVYNYEYDIFIYDPIRNYWLEPKDFSNNEYSIEKIIDLRIDFYDGKTYTLNDKEKEKLYNLSLELLNDSEGVMKDSLYLSEMKCGSVCYQFNKYPKNAYISLFDIGMNEEKMFLISVTDLFGYNVGEYIVFN